MLRLESLPEDILLDILGYIEPPSLLILSQTSKSFNRLCNLLVVWTRAYSSCTFPRPQSSSENFDFKQALLSALQVHMNWTSPRPTPVSRRLYSSLVSSMWLFRSRYLVTYCNNEYACWDLNRTSNTPLWRILLPGRVGEYEAGEMVLDSTPSIIFAYSVNSTSECCLISYPLIADNAQLQYLPSLSAPDFITRIGLGVTDIALHHPGGMCLVTDLTSSSQSYLHLTVTTPYRWIDTITVHPRLIILTSRRKGIAIDVYNIPEDAQYYSNSQEALNDSLSLEPLSTYIAQAQTLVLSAPQIIRQQSEQSSVPALYKLHILAALPFSVDHYSLTLPQMDGDARPSLDLKFLGDDQGSRQRMGGMATRPRLYGLAPDDSGYDSDSIPSRIVQPSQVLDLEIGPLGKRAIAIQIASHTNDRTVWSYTIPDGPGDLIARKLTFGMRKEPVHDADASMYFLTREDVQDILKHHACRTAFDEISGAVVVAADCEKFVALQY